MDSYCVLSFFSLTVSLIYQAVVLVFFSKSNPVFDVLADPSSFGHPANLIILLLVPSPSH